MVIYRSLNNEGLQHCLGMHKLQKQPDEAKGVTADFVEFIQTKISETNRNLKFILNVDQSPIFLLIMEKTLKYQDACSVNMRASTSETKHLIMACTITMDGTKLTPILIFKGKVYVCV